MLSATLAYFNNGTSVTFKTLNILAVGIASGAVSMNGVGSVILSIIGMVCLVWYELKRKFKKDPITGLWDFIDRNFVRLIFFAIIAPNALYATIQFFKSLL